MTRQGRQVCERWISDVGLRCEIVGSVGVREHEYLVSQGWSIVDVKVALIVKAPSIGYAATAAARHMRDVVKGGVRWVRVLGSEADEHRAWSAVGARHAVGVRVDGADAAAVDLQREAVDDEGVRGPGD